MASTDNKTTIPADFTDTAHNYLMNTDPKYAAVQQMNEEAQLQGLQDMSGLFIPAGRFGQGMGKGLGLSPAAPVRNPFLQQQQLLAAGQRAKNAKPLDIAARDRGLGLITPSDPDAIAMATANAVKKREIREWAKIEGKAAEDKYLADIAATRERVDNLKPSEVISQPTRKATSYSDFN